MKSLSGTKKTYDGWGNIKSGVGTSRDRGVYTRIRADKMLTEIELNRLYDNDGFAAKVINRYVSDMLRTRFIVDGDPLNKVCERLDEIGGWKELEDHLRWNRLHGGALCVMGIDDGGLLEDPLDEESVRSLEFLRAYDRWSVTVEDEDRYQNENKPKFGEPEYFTIKHPKKLDPNFTYRVHESRCLVLYGEPLSRKAREKNNGWGASFLQKCYTQLKHLGTLYPNLSIVIEDFVTGVLKMQDLHQMMAGDQEANVLKRIDVLDTSKSTLNTVLIDAESEEYEKKSSSVSGLAELVDKFLQALSVVSGLTSRILLGEQGGGMNNNGEGETGDWLDQIMADQLLLLAPAYEKVTRIIFLSKEGYFKGVEPENWFISFKNLKEPSSKEQAEIYKLNSEGDTNYTNGGILLPVEVAKSRFSGVTYGRQITLSEPDEKRKVEVKERSVVKT